MPEKTEMEKAFFLGYEEGLVFMRDLVDRCFLAGTPTDGRMWKTCYERYRTKMEQEVDMIKTMNKSLLEGDKGGKERRPTT